VNLAAGALIGLLGLVGSPLDDKTFQPALKKFHDDYYKAGAKDDEKIFAVNTLAQYKHERIVKVLAPLLTEASLAIRIMTARALAQFSGVDAAPREMLTALQSQANWGKKQAAVRIELLRGLGSLRYKSGAVEVSRFVDDKEVWVAKAAIDAAARIRVQEAIAPLIKALGRIEGRDGDAEISLGPLDDVFAEIRGNLFKADPRQQPKRPSEREFLKAPILAALQSITRETHTSARDWDSWWTKNKLTFKVTE
jgi:HEAT repeat protein